jgi:hypothetical protein
MVIKTYFNKNNTLVCNSLVNTARNPIAELFYGGTSSSLQYSRYIFSFDETKLKDLYTGGTFPNLSKLTHTLKMYNTGLLNPTTLNGTYVGMDRTSSFDLILFQINQAWDEGIGYDYASNNYNYGSPDVAYTPSNWAYAQTAVPWINGAGVYSGSPSGITIGTQHFDQGNENLSIDMTSVINAIITGDANNGFGLAFASIYEQLAAINTQYVGFFNKSTQTFFEPYIESIYSEHICDDRGLFYLDKPNKLYLYVNINGQPTNLDSNPTVTVFDVNSNIVSAYTQTAVTLVTKGIYSIPIQITSSFGYTDCMMFNDIWSGLTIGGVSRPGVELDFVLRDSTQYYDIGDNDRLPAHYGFSISGIKREEEIISGDIRKVIVSARIPFTVNKRELINDLQYRVYINEGPNQIIVIDWEEVEKANYHNYFLLDTESLLPNNRYYIDLKLNSNNEISTIENVVSFSVVNFSNNRG